jgi:hypothetical protein
MVSARNENKPLYAVRTFSTLWNLGMASPVPRFRLPTRVKGPSQPHQPPPGPAIGSFCSREGTLAGSRWLRSTVYPSSGSPSFWKVVHRPRRRRYVDHERAIRHAGYPEMRLAPSCAVGSSSLPAAHRLNIQKKESPWTLQCTCLRGRFKIGVEECIWNFLKRGHVRCPGVRRSRRPRISHLMRP